jgi:hypothetical protein
MIPNYRIESAEPERHQILAGSRTSEKGSPGAPLQLGGVGEFGVKERRGSKRAASRYSVNWLTE